MENRWKRLCEKLKQEAGHSKDTAQTEGEGRFGKLGIKWEDIGFSRLAILFLAGILLLLLSLPSGFLSGQQNGKEQKEKTDNRSEKQESAWDAMSEYAAGQEREVERILSQVEGIGKVDVMITIASSEEKKTLQKEDVSEEDTQESDSVGGSRKQSSSRAQREPILVGEGDQDAPYLVQLKSPQIEGVVVVAQGAGRGSVNTEIIEAVGALFSIEAHKIKVMKMEM